MNVRDAIPTIDDWKLLMSHTNASLNSSKKESFNNATHLFATNADVNDTNIHSLASLHYHITCSIVAALSRKCYRDVDDEKNAR